MADPNSSEKPRNTDPATVDEREIERVLDQAAGLAGQIVDEVGVEEVVPGSIADLSQAAAEGPAVDVEACLDEVEARLKAFAGAPDEGRPPPTESARTDSQAVESAVEEIPAIEPQAGDAVELQSESSSNKGLQPARPAHDAPSPPPAVTRRPTMIARLRHAFSAITAFVDSTIDSTLTIALRTFDFMDGIFAFVSYDVRKILGWVALAMFVAACALTASSLS